MRSRSFLGLTSALMIVASLNGFAADHGRRPDALGLIAGRDLVWVNNEHVLPGRAVFPGDTIVTGAGSPAVMNLRSGTNVTIAENSTVLLSRDGGLTRLNLRQGALVVRSTNPNPTRVGVVGGAITVQGEAAFPAVCRIAAIGNAVAVFADRGHVEIHGAGAPLVLAPGKSAQLEAGIPQGAGQLAGKVNAAIPDEIIQRQGRGPEIELKLADAVNWEDLIRTMKSGRVRVELLEGSFLNIGARSQMRITKHDPQTQQTQIELTLGRMRGEVVKITKPGGSFEVRTRTAVIGVVGTIFIIEALQNLTRVYCVEGTVSVRNIQLGVGRGVTLRGGEVTNVAPGQVPTAPTLASATRIQQATKLTQVPGPKAPPIGPGAPGQAPGVAARSKLGEFFSTANKVRAVNVAGGLTSSALTGVAVSSLGEATTKLEGTAASLAFAQNSSNAAVAAANAAAAASAGVSSGTQAIYQQLVSPSYPSGE